MKVHVITALGAAALFVGCSGSSKETRTASNTGTTTQGSVQGTQSAAGSQGQVSAQGTSDQASAQGTMGTSGTGSSSSTSSMGNDRSGQVSTSQTNPNTGSSSSTYGQAGTTGSSGSTTDQSGTAGTSGSTYGQSGTTGSSGSMDRSASASSANLKSAVGRVQKVDSDSKSISIASRGGSPITLTVDDSTQIVDSSGSTTSDLSAIKEGSQVRASFDPASNHAQRIEVMGRSKKMHKRSGSSDQTGSLDQSEGSMKTKPPNPNTSKSPAQNTTGTPSNVPPDQKQ